MKEILITSSVLIAVLLLLRVIFAKKVSRMLIYSAWALVALRLLIPVQIGQLDFSMLTAAKPVIEAVDERVEDAILGTAPEKSYEYHIQHYIEKDPSVFIPEVQEQIQQEISQGTQTQEEIFEKIQQEFPEQEILTPEGQETVQMLVGMENATRLHNADTIVATIWLAGIAIMAIWFTIVNLRYSRMLRRNREKMDCDSPIPVYVSERVGSPCLVGFFRPAIYLTPESAEDPTVLRHVLTHELTHYAHKDHIWSVVRCVCLCVYWFDPLVWVAAWFSRRDCELACDEGALKRLGEGERIAYGKSLLDVVSHASTPANLMQTATSMNETKKQLKERVNFIVKKQKISIIAAVCMVIVCAIVAGCAAAGPTNGEKPGVDPKPSTPSSSDTTPSSSTTRPTDPTDPDDPNPKKWIQLLTKVEHRGEVEIALTYDEQWNLKEVDGGTKRRIEIDAANRTMKVYLPEGGDFLAEAYTYDAAGNLVMMQSFGYSGYTEEYFYDASGKLQKQICTYAEDDSIFSGMKIETVYNYDEAGRKESQYEYQYIEDFPGEVVRYEGKKIFYQYDALGNLIREDWYTSKGDKMQYVIYTFDAEHRSEKREVFEEKETWEGKFDVLKEMSIYYYNAEGKVICIEEYNPESQRVEFTYTYVYQTVQVPVDFFAPLYVNPTERKVIFQGDDSQPAEPVIPQKVTYTIKAVDTQGNPVADVPIVKYCDTGNVFLTDENGMYQWEDYEREMPFFPPTGKILDGYAYSGYTQEGNVYTILMRPIITYTVKVLKENGEPLVNATVSLSGSVDFDWTSTDINGIATLSLPEDYYEVEVTHFGFRDGEEIWTQKYEIVEGQTEATFIWVDDTVNYKVKVVDKNGNPINKIEVEIWEENMDGYIPTVKTDENGEAIFKARVRQYTIILFIVVADDSAEGGCRVFSYGTFTFSGDETEVVIEVGEPEEVSP